MKVIQLLSEYCKLQQCDVQQSWPAHCYTATASQASITSEHHKLTAAALHTGYAAYTKYSRQRVLDCIYQYM
jgi:hypothetical protein